MALPLTGFLNLDKPSGMTSHDVVQRVRRALGVRRVGHAGTLDPLATGVLLVGVGRATRLIEYLMGQPKRYAAQIRLGQTTDTYDADGQVLLERPFAHLTQAAVETALAAFRGEIAQQPPMYSAIKRQGQPLYKLARRGVTLDLPARPVHLYALAVDAWQPPLLSLDLTCSAGTYVRSLAHDLGEALGCGGHIVALRRTAVGSFQVADAVPPEAPLQPHLLPLDTAVAHLPRLALTAAEAERLRLGQQIARPADGPDAALVRAYDETGLFLGLLEADETMWQPKKLFLPESGV